LREQYTLILQTSRLSGIIDLNPRWKLPFCGIWLLF